MKKGSLTLDVKHVVQKSQLKQLNKCKMENQTFIVNEMTTPHGVLIVITDKNILNKKFENETLQLDLTKQFYQGEEKTKEEILTLLKKAYVVHFTGVYSVDIGIELGIIDHQKILIIDNVPHAECYLG